MQGPGAVSQSAVHEGRGPQGDEVLPHGAAEVPVAQAEPERLQEIPGRRTGEICGTRTVQCLFVVCVRIFCDNSHSFRRHWSTEASIT